MSWIPFAIVGPFFWALTNFVDKYLLGKLTCGTYDFTFFCSAAKVPALLVLLCAFGMPTFGMYALIPIISGALVVYSYFFYGKALEKGDTSTLITLLNLTPVAVFIIAYLFLGQTMGGKELFAFIIILMGSLVISIERINGRTSLIKGFGPALVFVLSWAVIFVMNDFGLAQMSFGSFMFWYTLGSILAGPTLLTFPIARGEILKGIRTATAHKYSLFCGNGLIDLLAHASINYALVLATSAALVNVVTQTQSFFSITMGVLLTIFFPHIIKEDISFKTLGKKVLGAMIMFGGIYLLLV